MKSIDLACAKLIIDQFIDLAKALQIVGEITVVDKFANPVAYARMDDYKSADHCESQKLARAAASFALSTERLCDETAPGKRFAHLLNSVQYSANIGGYPIILEGELIGAIGICIDPDSLIKPLSESLLAQLTKNLLSV